MIRRSKKMTTESTDKDDKRDNKVDGLEEEYSDNHRISAMKTRF